ncbi:VWA domain-containing protein [Candidatus Dependentiae bacterium]|nr:VWA domain-containing protein [Candidatus Dependentiae bacterium]
MMFDLQKIHWAGMAMQSYAILILLIVFFLFIVKTMKFYKVLRFLFPDKLELFSKNIWRKIRFFIKIVLLFIGMFFLLLALLRPQSEKEEEVIKQQGRDILIALDISRSMLAQDEKPNRLEFAKQKIRKMLSNLKCERVGLILFSGTTVLQCPLTKDYAAFFMFLDQIDAETISSSTTCIDQAIRQAIRVYEPASDKKTKLLCLFTDGEDFSSHLSDIKEKAVAQGLSIFTIGIGSEHGAPIPILDQNGNQIGLEKDDSGKIVMSKLNEGILKNLSKQTGGHYIHATVSNQDIEKLISFVETFEKDSLQDASINRFQEEYHYCVAVSFICFVLEWLL